MFTRTKIIVLFLIAATGLAACAPASVQAGQGSPTPAPSTTPTAPDGGGGTPDPGSTLTVTLADNGQTITLHVDEEFLL